MTVRDFLTPIADRLFAELAERPMFWVTLTVALIFIFACSMACFAKKPLRALICGALAFECAWFMSAGFVG